MRWCSSSKQLQTTTYKTSGNIVRSHVHAEVDAIVKNTLNLKSSRKNLLLTSEIAFCSKPDGRNTYTTAIKPGKKFCKQKQPRK